MRSNQDGTIACRAGAIQRLQEVDALLALQGSNGVCVCMCACGRGEGTAGLDLYVPYASLERTRLRNSSSNAWLKACSKVRMCNRPRFSQVCAMDLQIGNHSGFSYCLAMYQDQVAIEYKEVWNAPVHFGWFS